MNIITVVFIVHVVLGIILIVSAALNKIGWIKRSISSLIRGLYSLRTLIRKWVLRQSLPILYPQTILTYIIKGLFYLRNKAKKATLIMGIGILMFSKNITSLFGYYIAVWLIQQWVLIERWVSEVWYEIWRAYPWGFPGPMGLVLPSIAEQDNFVNFFVTKCQLSRIYRCREFYGHDNKRSNMKLKGYFQHYKHMELSPTEKFSLFEKIMEQKFAPQKQGLLARILYAKTLRYSVATFLIVAGAYGANIFRNDIAFFAGSLMIEDSSVVQAGYIAKIIDFQGAFYIEHKGKNIVSTAINAGDIVTLKKGTKITFNIDEKTQGTIVGPAQFEIQEEKNTNLRQSIYKLNIIRGDFVQIASINDTTEQNIDINIQDITVRQRIGQTASRYTITKKGGQHIVNNQGASLLVATADNQKTISSKQILAVANNDITLIEDEKIIASAINNGDVSQTINIGDNKPNTEDIELAALLTEVSSDTTIDVSTVNLVMTKIGDQNEKIVPTPEQNTQIQNTLNGKFLMNNMQSIFINPGNTKAMQQIADKLTLVAKSLDIKIQTRASLESITNSSTELANQLETRYFISPTSIANLRAIASWATYIKKQEVFIDIDSANKAWEELTNNMPSNLRFQ